MLPRFLTTYRWPLVGVVVLVLGIGVGVGLVRWLDRDEPGEPGRAPTARDEGTTPAPATAEPIELGAEPDEPLPTLPELAAFNRASASVAERVMPSVVFIESELGQGFASADAGPEGFGGRRSSAGSGVVISRDGHVITNAHVVEGAARIRVLLNDKREYDAELIGSDPTTDLAVIRLLRGADDELPLPVAVLGDSDDLVVGEWVMAVGNPFRLQSTVTTGIVSALGRQVNIIEDDFSIEDFVQTDAAINPGNSGGALVNAQGEVVGIATAIATDTGSNQGYGFAVPIALATRVAADLIDYGEVRRGFLGVEILPVTAADARELGLPAIEGVLIASVAGGGAAQRAGLRPRDVLLTIDGEPVNAPNQFQSRIARRRPGEEVAMTIWRAGERRELDARLIGAEDDAFRSWLADLQGRGTPDGAPPPIEEVPPGAPRYDAEDWGVRLRDLTPAERRLYGVSGGAYVEAIQPGSAAELDGLPAGTVVTRIERTEVTTAEQARALLAERAQSGEPALMRVRRRDGATAFYDLVSPFVD